MECGSIVRCCRCQKPIVSGEGFVCFKVFQETKPTNFSTAGFTAETAGKGTSRKASKSLLGGRPSKTVVLTTGLGPTTRLPKIAECETKGIE